MKKKTYGALYFAYKNILHYDEVTIKKINKNPSTNDIFNLDTYFREHCLSVLTLFLSCTQTLQKENMKDTRKR